MSRLAIPSPLLQAALRRPASQLIPHCVAKAPTTARSFSHLPTLRPTLLPHNPVFRAAPTTTTTTQAQLSLFQPTPSSSSSPSSLQQADVVPKHAITSHPALAGVATQVRCGPRATMSNASRLVQKRRHGFLSRIRTKAGRNTLARRRAKGRKRLSY